MRKRGCGIGHHRYPCFCRMCRCVGPCLCTVLCMYAITLLMLLFVAVITFFCGKDAFFAKGGVIATYIVVGFFAGVCRKKIMGIQKWTPMILYLGVWYVIMLGTGKNGAKDHIQLAIITVIITLSFVLGSIFHKS